jgi:hypothetical protein
MERDLRGLTALTLRPLIVFSAGFRSNNRRVLG